MANRWQAGRGRTRRDHGPPASSRRADAHTLHVALTDGAPAGRPRGRNAYTRSPTHLVLTEVFQSVTPSTARGPCIAEPLRDSHHALCVMGARRTHRPRHRGDAADRGGTPPVRLTGRVDATDSLVRSRLHRPDVVAARVILVTYLPAAPDPLLLNFLPIERGRQGNDRGHPTPPPLVALIPGARIGPYGSTTWGPTQE